MAKVAASGVLNLSPIPAGSSDPVSILPGSGFSERRRGLCSKAQLVEQGTGRVQPAILNVGVCRVSHPSPWQSRDGVWLQVMSVSAQVLQVLDAQQSSVLALLRGPSCSCDALPCKESEHAVNFPDSKPFSLFSVFSSRSRVHRVSWGDGVGLSEQDPSLYCLPCYRWCCFRLGNRLLIQMTDSSQRQPLAGV